MIKLTKTMLDKCIIDANAEVRAVALKMGIDYETMAPGFKHVVEAQWSDLDKGEIRFYKTARGDRRVSFKDIKKHCDVGDTITIQKRRVMPIIGVVK